MPRTFEELAHKLVNCDGIASKFKGYLEERNSCPGGNTVDFLVGLLGLDISDYEGEKCDVLRDLYRAGAEEVCTIFTESMVDAVLGEIDENISKSTSLSLQGVATTIRNSTVDNGQWNASTKFESFEGTFKMQKTGRTTR